MRDGSLPFARKLFPRIDALGTLFTKALCDLAKRRPCLFERLGEYRSSRFFIDPIDLSFGFLVVPDGDRSVVRVVDKSEKSSASIVIDGPVLMLLSLLDATVDGAALVRRQVISVEGPNDATLALRQAVDQGNLRPADLFGTNWRLKELTNHTILGILRAARHFACQRPAQPETA